MTDISSLHILFQFEMVTVKKQNNAIYDSKRTLETVLKESITLQ